MDLDGLSKISSLVGIPTKTDVQRREKSMLSYAKPLVKMDLAAEFPEFVDFINEKGLVIEQKVKYE